MPNAVVPDEGFEFGAGETSAVVTDYDFWQPMDGERMS